MSLFRGISVWMSALKCRWDSILSDRSPIHFAIKEKRPDVVEYLCKKGYNVNVPDCYDGMPIHYAAARGDVKSLDILLKYCADIEALTNHRSSALHIAARGDYDLFVKKIIEYGLNPNLKGLNWQTPLHEACQNGCEKCVKYLLSLPELNINAQDFDKNTPLHTVILNKNTKLLSLLLDPQINKLHFHEIDISLKNNFGKTAFDMLDYLPEYNEKEAILHTFMQYAYSADKNKEQNLPQCFSQSHPVSSDYQPVVSTNFITMHKAMPKNMGKTSERIYN